MRKLKTIKLSGKEYAQVAERLRAIHEDYPRGGKNGDFDIVTVYDMTERGVIFTANLTIREGGSTRAYTGHSYGGGGKEKAFEKLETIAVGRALAFAGYHADGEIASADEMQEMAKEVDTEALANALAKISEANSVKELNKVYRELPITLKQNKEVIEACKEKKHELTTIVA